MRDSRLHLLRRLSNLVSTATLVFILSACHDGAETGAAPLVRVRDLRSPAGEGSGEPSLSPDGDGVLLSWMEEGADGGWSLRLARFGRRGWTGASTVAAGRGFFVNWADFPSVTAVGRALVAHWLERSGDGAYAYGVRLARSLDGGRTWSAPWTPHEDASATEHGFVSVLPLADGAGVAWLDGRDFAAAGDAATPAMTLRWRAVPTGGGTWQTGLATPEVEIDGRVCDCCQTAAVMTAQGPVVVYRDRSPEEIRDIHAVRLVAGRWRDPVPVHADGWEMPSCPVNGPAAEARGDTVVVGWFTGADGTPRVRAAFSTDAGASFGPPVEIDGGDPAGRVDVLLLADGSALVSWLERVGSGTAQGADGVAEVRVRRVWPEGRRSPPSTITRSGGGRAAGFPRMARSPGGGVLFAWTDVLDGGSRVRLVEADLATPEHPFEEGS